MEKKLILILVETSNHRCRHLEPLIIIIIIIIMCIIIKIEKKKYSSFVFVIFPTLGYLCCVNFVVVFYHSIKSNQFDDDDDDNDDLTGQKFEYIARYYSVKLDIAIYITKKQVRKKNRSKKAKFRLGSKKQSFSLIYHFFLSIIS